jgi:hypothetical protein
MATLGSYFLNGPSLSSSTSIFSDIGLTTIAPDGFYSDGVTSREQLSGILLPETICIDCGTPCGEPINASGGQGIYLVNLNLGSSLSNVGAVIIRFRSQQVPDGIRVVYNGVTYNKLSSPISGVQQSSAGANNFTVIGNSAFDCGLAGNTTNFPTLTEYLYEEGSFVPTGNTQDITIYPGDVVLGSFSGLAFMVIPKPNVDPAIANIQVIGPCSGTVWDITTSCPELLPEFSGSERYEDPIISCSDSFTRTYYFAKVHLALDSFVGLYDFVFKDAYGVNMLGNGFYLINNVALPNKVIEVNNGVVVSISDCDGVTCLQYEAQCEIGTGDVDYTDCNGDGQSISLNQGDVVGFCAKPGTISSTGGALVSITGNC